MLLEREAEFSRKGRGTDGSMSSRSLSAKLLRGELLTENKKAPASRGPSIRQGLLRRP